MYSHQDRNPARRFAPFVPPTGPFPKVDIAEAGRRSLIATLRREVEYSGWRMRMQQAAHIVIDTISRVGLRFELLCRDLAEGLGLSDSMGSYYLRRLRDAGFLTRYRKHYIDWDKTDALRELMDNEDVFCAAPAVHELNMRRSEGTFKSHPPGSGSQGPMDEKLPLSRGST